jgi:hypothetical protein
MAIKYSNKAIKGKSKMSSIIDNAWETLELKGDHAFFGLEIKDGTVAERLTIAEFNNCIFQFPAFTPWKLYLIMASEAENRAIDLSTKFISTELSKKSIDKKKIYSLSTANPNEMLEYFKSIITAYTFSQNALEAYINSRIDTIQPTEEDYINLEQLIKKHLFTNVVEVKTDLLRTCPIEDKIFYILPYFLKKQGIGLKEINSFVPTFKIINAVRNHIAHIKRKEIRTGQHQNGKFNTNNFWNNLIPRFDKKGVSLRVCPAQFATKLIEYYQNKYKGDI